MKKALSIILCFIMSFSCFAFSASAMSASEGLTALGKQFSDGKNTYEYCYYSPVKKTSDKTKYPLIIWLHGQFSGNTKRYQLDNCDVALWSSTEYQAKIRGTGGAFIFLPRDPTLNTALQLAWNGDLTGLKKSIDEFVNQYKANIDTSRIYLGGYSMGGKAVIRLASLYPGYFAAIFPMSSVYEPNKAQLRALKDTPIWMFTCKDDVINENPTKSHAVSTSIWEYLETVSTCKNINRWSYFVIPLVTPDGKLSAGFTYLSAHNSWDAVAHDLILSSGKLYSNMITVDGYGNAVTLNIKATFLYWLSSQTLNGSMKDDNDKDEDKTPELPATSLLGAIDKIFKFIYKLIELLF